MVQLTSSQILRTLRLAAIGLCIGGFLAVETARSEVITFKDGAAIDVAGITIPSYSGTFDVSLRSGGTPGILGGSTSNYGNAPEMYSAQDGATSLLRFDISAMEGMFSAINSVQLVLYPRNGAQLGETMVHRLADWNSGWVEGGHDGSFTCCIGQGDGASWDAFIGQFALPSPGPLWASHTQGPNVPGTDYDAGDFVDGQLEGIGRTDNSVAIEDAPFVVDITAQSTSPFFPSGGTTNSLFDLVTDWASADAPSGWNWIPDRLDPVDGWSVWDAVNGIADPPSTPNEGFLIKGGVGSEVMEFWQHGFNSAYNPELIIDFTPLGGCDTGDADCDGDVDLDDIIAAVGNFTGPCTDTVDCFGDPGNGASPFTKVRIEGDVNDRSVSVTGTLPLQSDGDVDLDDIIDMVGAFTGPLDSEDFAAASAGDAGLPDLVYDPATGEVFLDAADIGGTLQAYNIKNAGGGILNGAFTPILGGAPATDLPTEIGEFQLSSTPTAPGGTSIGLVFPIGMDQAALEAFVTGGSAAPAFGGGSFAWELIALGPSVPEPSTFILGGLGLMGLALVGYRRRRVTEGR